MEIPNQVEAGLDRIAKLPKAARAGIVVAICLLLGAGYYFGMYQGARQQLDDLHAKEMQLQRKLNEVRSIAANIGEFEEEIAQLEVKLGAALRQLPNQKELEVLLTDMSNLGKSAGVEIQSFRRRKEVVHDFYAEVPIDLELEGGYHDIALFFDRMARLPRIVNMGSLDMKVSSESLEGTRLKVTGTATAFRFVGSDQEA